MHNPSLREEPRDQLAEVIPLQHETSLLDWLESNNRLIPREVSEDNSLEEEEEISELMGVDEGGYDDEDDEDLIEDE
jgi:hypothetical protein